MLKTPEKIPENLVSDIKSIAEEKANFYSHFAGIIFWFLTIYFILKPVLLLEDSLVQFGVYVYLTTFLMIFSSSSLYHSSYVAEKRIKLRSFDHISIYFFIVGTYTAIILLYIQNNFGYKVLAILWLVTFIGSIFKMFFVGKFKILSTIIYLAMGWTAIFIIKELKTLMPAEILTWIVAGGIVYTVGTFFYINKKIKYNHLYWHLAVLAGAICHFVAIYLSVK